MTYAAEVDNFLPSGPNGITVFADVHGYTHLAILRLWPTRRCILILGP